MTLISRGLVTRPARGRTKGRDGWIDDDPQRKRLYAFCRPIPTPSEVKGRENMECPFAAGDKLEETVADRISKGTYTYSEIESAVRMLDGRKVILSNQYGMMLLIDDENRIIMRLNPLLKDPKEAMDHA